MIVCPRHFGLSHSLEPKDLNPRIQCAGEGIPLRLTQDVLDLPALLSKLRNKLCEPKLFKTLISLVPTITPSHSPCQQILPWMNKTFSFLANHGVCAPPSHTHFLVSLSMVSFSLLRMPHWLHNLHLTFMTLLLMAPLPTLFLRLSFSILDLMTNVLILLVLSALVMVTSCGHSLLIVAIILFFKKSPPILLNLLSTRTWPFHLQIHSEKRGDVLKSFHSCIRSMHNKIVPSRIKGYKGQFQKKLPISLWNGMLMMIMRTWSWKIELK